jgi:predicted phosphodiesterase
MAKIKQFRDPDLSLWQSAVDQVVARKTSGTRSQDIGGGGAVTRPDSSDSMVHAASVDLTAEDRKKPLVPPLTGQVAATEGLVDMAKFCSTIARKLAWATIKGDHVQAALLKEQFEKYGLCDPGWLEVAAEYEKFQLQKGKVPYRVYTNIDDFVIDGKLPDKARVAIIGDWGTGDDTAKRILKQIAAKKPHAIIHLGDIYYSCTDFEVDNYFLQIWKNYFDISKQPSFSLSGNHDMFAGGGPYYKMIDQLGQPASYFCLRHANWQFVAIDTGLHDRVVGGTEFTYLEDTEVAWLKRRLDTFKGKTVLLSHHQLFSAFEDIIPGKAVNEKLKGQIGSLLPQVAVWLCGHEHDCVIYKEQMGVLMRCIGHGAIPVAIPGADGPARTPRHPEILIEDVNLGDDGGFYNHGYAIMDLDGAQGTISYYQESDENKPQWIDRL